MQHQPLPPLVRLISFGFLHSAPPPEAHVVIDLRTHFRDPHVSPELRQLTSSNPRVREHVLATAGISELVEAIAATALAMTSGPARADVVIAVGCAGGRHRARLATPPPVRSKPRVSLEEARAMAAEWAAMCRAPDRAEDPDA